MDIGDVSNGDRINGFLIIKDRDGRLHGLRMQGVTGLSADDDATVMALTGGRCLVVEEPFWRVLSWFGPGPR